MLLYYITISKKIIRGRTYNNVKRNIEAYHEIHHDSTWIIYSKLST